MILDQQRVFLDKKALTATDITSDILAMGKGEASSPMTLVIHVTPDAGAGTLTTTLETAKTEVFASPVTLATYTGCPLKAVLPRGNQGYLRLKVKSTFTKGAVTAALVFDDDVQ